MNKPVRVLVKKIKIIKYYEYIQPIQKNINHQSVTEQKIKIDKNIKYDDKNYDDDYLNQIMINGGF